MKRELNGLVLLNKPKNISSNKALVITRAIFQAKKAGHTGSLDPLATGLLPICFGDATKYSEYLLNANKTYVVKAKLGFISSTEDAEGNIEFISSNIPTKAQIKNSLIKFTGNIQQVPSKYSAIKVDGRPLYAYARKNQPIPNIAARDICINDLQLIKYAYPYLTLKVNCSKGTYIRSLVRDIGLSLKVGAYTLCLSRTDIENISISSAYTLDAFRNIQESEKLKVILPVELFIQLPKLYLNEAETKSIINGVSVNSSKLRDCGEYAIYANTRQFIGVGTIEKNLLKPKRLINSKLVKI